MISITYTTSNPEEMKTIAKDILLKCSGPGIFTFSGNLGAGKTTLIREMCHHLGYKGDVTSPTFSLVNEYSTGSEVIYHMDLYRLKNMEEAYDIGIEEYLFSGEYCFIEWPEIIEPILNDGHWQVKIEVNSEGVRKIDVSKIPQTTEIS
ncbi:MAG: tRNA (adenosine(37)-N6)-threonylcarbamoyltransferase complex ATPase subunit type 1 TsaE [Saprospiraceae bacterium]|jgi:tRNA threonylcarbamoyladenosine biosynthesis protein TsaE